MYCPLCGDALKAVERQNIEIDWCPQCGGLWLDQGELNELVRREAEAALLRGQEALVHERRNREYDYALDLPQQETIDMPAPFATSRGEAALVSAR